MKKPKTRFKPVQGLASQSIVRILQTAKKEVTFKQLQSESIQFKQAFLKYLRFLLKKKLLKYRNEWNRTYYKTTKKGERLMNLLCYTDRPKQGQRWKPRFKK